MPRRCRPGPGRRSPARTASQRLASRRRQARRRRHHGADDAATLPATGRFKAHTRGFVQVQNGCDHRCTFCVIPFGRGNSRSLAMDAVLAQCRRLTEAGAREIVLTGVDLTSYGRDLADAPTLGRLVRTILRELPELPRLRLSSIDAVEVDDELREAIATEGRLMPHLHLSLQAGDDLILKRMKRRHNRDDAIRFCARDARAAARDGLRRRSDRRLPDRGRGDVFALARPDRGMRAELSSMSSPIRPARARRPRACRSFRAGSSRSGPAACARRRQRRMRRISTPASAGGSAC